MLRTRECAVRPAVLLDVRCGWRAWWQDGSAMLKHHCINMQHPDATACLNIWMIRVQLLKLQYAAQAQDRLQHVLEIDATLTGRQVGVRVEPHQRSLYSVYR